MYVHARLPANLRRVVGGAVAHDVDIADRNELHDGFQARAELSFRLRKIWNVRPSPPPPISPATTQRLAQHFLADVPDLAEALGRPVPWEADLVTAAAG